MITAKEVAIFSYDHNKGLHMLLTNQQISLVEEHFINKIQRLKRKHIFFNDLRNGGLKKWPTFSNKLLFNFKYDSKLQIFEI